MRLPSRNIPWNVIVAVVNKEVVLRHRDGKHYLTAYPKYKPNRVPTPKQLEVQQKFSKSAAYARDAMQDAAIKDLYEMKANKKRSAYKLAFSDAYHPPNIVSIDKEQYAGRRGNTIYVTAEDNFGVKKVVVSIYRNEKLIEEAEAAEGENNRWSYTATRLVRNLKNIKIKAVAYDLPGNTGVMEVEV